MGVALGGCTLPGAEKSGFTLADNEIELGLGIHGEKGVERSAMLPADQLTATLLDYIVEDMGLAAGARVALLVNLGATPQMELDVVMRAAYDKLAARGSPSSGPGRARCCRRWTCRAARCRCCAWTTAGWRCWTRPRRARLPGGGRVNQDIHVAAPAMEQGEAQAAPDAAGQRWIAALKPALVGGGGAARQGADADRAGFAGGRRGPGRQHEARRRRHPGGARRGPGRSDRRAGRAGRRAAQAIAGSSGPFYATALLRASRRLARGAQPSARDWAGAFSDAVQAVSDLGGAKAGDRTMLDALFPAAAAFEQGLAQGATPAVAFAAAVEAAEQGAQATAAMAPRAGRASYLGERAVGAPDGGAVAVACWLAALRPHVGSV